MKNFLSGILLLGSCATAYSQNTFPSYGNAGIGTLTPNSISGYSNLTINNPDPNGLGSFIDFQKNGSLKAIISGDDAGLIMVTAAGSGIPIRFATDGNEKMRILGNGNVGISNFLPQSRLEVAGPSGSFGSSGTFHSSGAQSWGHVVTLVTDAASGDDPKLLFSYRNNAKQWAIGGQFNTTRLSIWEDGGDGHHGTGSGTERFTVLPGGNVGIGISSPAEKLAVNGNIRAKEVKVETANWPDYVFAKEYELPSLQSTEQLIKEKGHLPGIPSAAEAKANGIDLGEMNAKLLQKIEELTLHLIDMKKNADLQQLEINKLKSKNK